MLVNAEEEITRMPEAGVGTLGMDIFVRDGRVADLQKS